MLSSQNHDHTIGVSSQGPPAGNDCPQSSQPSCTCQTAYVQGHFDIALPVLARVLSILSLLNFPA